VPTVCLTESPLRCWRDRSMSPGWAKLSTCNHHTNRFERRQPAVKFDCSGTNCSSETESGTAESPFSRRTATRRETPLTNEMGGPAEQIQVSIVR
jgi:hypothetical protein